MENVLVPVVLIGLINKAMDLVKFLKARAWDPAVTQLNVGVLGVLAFLAAGEIEATENYVVPGLTDTLHNLDLGSRAFIGLAVAWTGALFNDFKKAIDNTQSASTPTLFSGPSVPPGQ